MQERRRAATIWLGLHLLPYVDRLLVRYSLVGDPAVFDTALFPWAAKLERNWRAIREEADRVLADRDSIPPLRQISPDHRRIAEDDRWRSFFLWGYGIRSEANCRRCPRTVELIERIPDLQTALFSVLWPGAHIPRHTGVTKAILTCHLGLRIPKDRERCRIGVADQVHAWRDGKVLVFDDLRPHEIWNETDEDRVVLILHVKRPMRLPAALVRDALLAAVRRSAFIQDARRALDRWDRPGSDAGRR
jgi:beta-hydroxylase